MRFHKNQKLKLFFLWHSHSNRIHIPKLSNWVFVTSLKQCNKNFQIWAYNWKFQKWIPSVCVLLTTESFRTECLLFYNSFHNHKIKNFKTEYLFVLWSKHTAENFINECLHVVLYLNRHNQKFDCSMSVFCTSLTTTQPIILKLIMFLRVLSSQKDNGKILEMNVLTLVYIDKIHNLKLKSG